MKKAPWTRYWYKDRALVKSLTSDQKDDLINEGLRVDAIELKKFERLLPIMQEGGRLLKEMTPVK